MERNNDNDFIKDYNDFIKGYQEFYVEELGEIVSFYLLVGFYNYAILVYNDMLYISVIANSEYNKESDLFWKVTSFKCSINDKNKYKFTFINNCGHVYIASPYNAFKDIVLKYHYETMNTGYILK